MKNYEKIIKLNSEMKKIKDKIIPLRKKAILELYEMGFSMDRICTFLMMAKIDVINILHSNKIKIRKRRAKSNGRKR